MDSQRGLPAAENQLERNFTLTVPNQDRTADITYRWTDEGSLYLALAKQPPEDWLPDDTPAPSA